MMITETIELRDKFGLNYKEVMEEAMNCAARRMALHGVEEYSVRQVRIDVIGLNLVTYIFEVMYHDIS